MELSTVSVAGEVMHHLRRDDDLPSLLIIRTLIFTWLPLTV